MKSVAIAALGLCLMTGTVHAQDYDREIEENVVDPCLLHVLDNDPARKNSTMSREEMLTVSKIMMADTVESLKEPLLKLVPGKSEASRKTLYKFAAEACINGAREGRRKREKAAR